MSGGLEKIRYGDPTQIGYEDRVGAKAREIAAYAATHGIDLQPGEARQQAVDIDAWVGGVQDEIAELHSSNEGTAPTTT